MIRRLRARGIRSLLYLRSFVADDTAGTEPAGVVRRGRLARATSRRTSTGAPYLFPSPFPGATAAVIDFTDPAARAWWRGRVEALLDTGAEGFMNDFGEQVLPGMRFHDGSTGVTMHNRYPVLQAQVTREAVDALGAPPSRAARCSSSSGPATAAARAPRRTRRAQFPGDETVDWQPGTGLPSVVPDMLNRAVGGAPGFTMDIGGYAQFTTLEPDPAADRARAVRALVAGRRAHAVLPRPQLGARRRADAVGLRRRDAHRLARRRPAAPAGRAAGPAALAGVQPDGRAHDAAALARRPGGRAAGRGATTSGCSARICSSRRSSPRARRSRAVRLPAGCWRRHGTGPRLAGGRTVTVAAPLADLPWFARCGTRPI